MEESLKKKKEKSSDDDDDDDVNVPLVSSTKRLRIPSTMLKNSQET